MPVATLTSKGQLVVPEEIRKYLQLQPGGRLDFIVDDDGDVIIRLAVADGRELKGILHTPGRKPVSIRIMQDVIHQQAGRYES